MGRSLVQIEANRKQAVAVLIRMNKYLKFGFTHLAAPILGATSMILTAGCYTSPPHEYAGGRPARVIVDDDYVYYPGYEMYYNNHRRQYVYRDNNAWVTRSAPPSAWARELPSAPSVHLDFHDAPERHHAEVVRTYPKNWKPQPSKQPQPVNDRHDQKGQSDDDHHNSNDRR